MADLNHVIEVIKDLGRKRMTTIRKIVSTENATGAEMRVVMGWQADLSKAEQKKIRNRAKAAIKTIKKDIKASLKANPNIPVVLSYSDPNMNGLVPMVVSDYMACQSYTDYREDLEAEMEKRANELPIIKWWTDQKGLGPLGLAIIIGETGDLSNYSKPGKVWKRMGLAVMNGVRQGGLPKGSDAELWIEHGYCATRRSAIWLIGHMMLMSNKDYQKMCVERKRTEFEKAVGEGLTVITTLQLTVDNWAKKGLPAPTLIKKKAFDKKKHRKVAQINARAQRYVEKRLLRETWRAWRDAVK